MITSPISTSFRAATITLSDLGARGHREDTSGALLQDLLAKCGATIVSHEILPDDPQSLTIRLLQLSEQVSVVITTGGTGLSPRDSTPEATMAVVQKRIPGIEEALHQAGRDKVPTCILSRAVAGVRGTCLIINLPGSPGGVRDGMAVLAPILGHAVRLLNAKVRDCQSDLSGESSSDS